jgi:SAM-dependent methyltransferase
VWAVALDQLDALQRAGQVAALLLAAHDEGLLDRLAAGTGPQAAGVDADRLTAVLGVLAAYGVAEQVDGGWALTEGWRQVVQGESPVSLEAVLGFGRVRTEQLAAALSPVADYWQLSAGDRLLVARGASFDPTVPAGPAMVRADLQDLPTVVAALEQGGRLLELGCGVASRLTALLRAFPTATAVGVELAPDLVAYGRARAEQVGVADRLELVVADARSYQPEGLFDLVGWSQFFFPEPARAGALATALGALRPDGWVTMPVVWDGTVHPQGSPEQQELAVERLALDLWDVPVRSTAEVLAEVAAAGFVDVRVDSRPYIHFVRGRRP